MIKKFGVKLKHARKLNKLTLEELADSISSGKSYIWELENKDQCNPSALVVWRLSLVLNVPFEYLINDEFNIGTYPNNDNARFILKQIKSIISNHE